jgi:Na+/melibiose symporter-like transporter
MGKNYIPADDEELERLPEASPKRKGTQGFDGVGPRKRLDVPVSFLHMNCMLCFNLSNGVLLASYMLLVLPLESERIDKGSRSVILGSLMFIAGVTQLINPLVGLLSDRCMSSWGRRRPFIVLGGVAGILGIIAQDWASMNRNPVMYYVAYAMSMLALNTAYTAVVGIMPDLVPAEQAGMASGIAALHTVGGANLGFLVYANTVGSNDARLHAMYMSFVVITTACIALTVFACDEVPLLASDADNDDDQVGCAEPADAENGEEPQQQQQQQLPVAPARPPRSPSAASRANTRCFSQPVRHKYIIDSYYIDPRKHRDFTFVFWSRTFYYLGASVQTFFKFYLHDIVGVEDAEGAIVKTAIIGQLCAALTAIPTGCLSDRCGRVRKPFIYAACAVLAAGNVVNCFVRSEFEVYIVCGILGCANGVYLSMDAALALDTLPSGDEAARFMGVWGIGCFLGGAVGPVLGGPILEFCGKSLDGSAYRYNGYAILLVFAGICFLLSGVILHFVTTEGEGGGAWPWCVWIRRHARKLRSYGLQDIWNSAKAVIPYFTPTLPGNSPCPAHSSLKVHARGNAGPNWLNA